MNSFDLFVGIDYSGADTSVKPLKSLQVYSSDPDGTVNKWASPASTPDKPRNWTRAQIAQLLLDQSRSGKRFLAGIDHCFSFPDSYFQRYGLSSWPAFLDDFAKHWPTHQADVSVESVRSGQMHKRGGSGNGARIGKNTEVRLCERWTSSAKSVFLFDVQGAVAKSSHAGIPWLKWLRDEGFTSGRLMAGCRLPASR